MKTIWLWNVRFEMKFEWHTQEVWQSLTDLKASRPFFSFYDMKSSDEIVTVTIEMHGSIESPTSLDCIEAFFRVIKEEYEKSCKNAENQ